MKSKLSKIVAICQEKSTRRISKVNVNYHRDCTDDDYMKENYPSSPHLCYKGIFYGKYILKPNSFCNVVSISQIHFQNSCQCNFEHFDCPFGYIKYENTCIEDRLNALKFFNCDLKMICLVIKMTVMITKTILNNFRIFDGYF